MRKKLLLLSAILGQSALSFSMELAEPLALAIPDTPRRLSRSNFRLSLLLTSAVSENDDISRSRAEGASCEIPELEEDIKSPKSLGKQLVVTCRSAHMPGMNLAGRSGPLILEDYIKKGADLDACDRQGSALMWLAFFGLEELFYQLLNAKASITATSDHQYNALHAAAQRGHSGIVKHIIENKLLPMDCQGWCGSTPLHLAVQAGQQEVVDYLLAQGASVQLSDSVGRTPLHLAVWRDDARLCLALLKAGADVNAPMQGGFTPLHLAKYYRRTVSLDLLMKAGADITRITDAGWSVVECASRADSKDLLYAIQEAIRRRAEK